MAENIRIRLDQQGLNALLRSEQGDIAKDLLRRAAKVERAAKRYAPVDTGRLRSSITHSMNKDAKGIYASVGTNVEYAIFQEFGTRYQSGTPFLRPALREAQ